MPPNIRFFPIKQRYLVADSTALWDTINEETTAVICDNGLILHASSFANQNTHLLCG